MSPQPTAAEIRNITDNNDPDEVWLKARDIVKQIQRDYDFTLAEAAFRDVLNLFLGKYPGYCAIKTPYHNLYHTLDVFICSVRLAHGIHLSGTPLTAREITQIMLATLMHDIGYAQQLDEASGTGAQFTLTHVGRGIKFMRQYLLAHKFPEGDADTIAHLMNSTNPAMEFDQIAFPDHRTRMLAQIVGTADIVGQMADRIYLEKLLFLYLEFKEARFANFASTHDLILQTKQFYDMTREKKLDGAYDAIYTKFSHHFKAYLEAIDRNLAYLSKVISLNEADRLAMLKRGGIVDQTMSLPAYKGDASA
jgi:hypothetical protein